METDRQHPEEPTQRWYTRAGHWTSGVLYTVCKGIKKAAKPALVVLALGAAGYGGWEVRGAYEDYRRGPLEETLMEQSVEIRAVRQGDKVYLEQRMTKTQQIDIESMLGDYRQTDEEPYSL